MLNTSVRFIIFTLCAFMCLFTSCEDNRPLVNPFESTQVQIKVEFPDLSSGLQKNTASQIASDNAGIQTIDEVSISVLDASTAEIIINQQILEIGRDAASGARTATGAVTIPVTRDEQTFTFIVFASDVQNLIFLLGSKNLPLSRGDIELKPVRIDLAIPNSVAQNGTAIASSVTQVGNNSAGLGIDFDTGTSWFSDGTRDGDTSSYIWTASDDSIFVAVCGIFNNSLNSNPEFRSGFGFNTVTFQLFSGADAGGNLVYEETVDYPKSAELPVVKVAPLAFGKSVRLLLSGRENQSGGGFSEFLVVGAKRF